MNTSHIFKPKISMSPNDYHQQQQQIGQQNKSFDISFNPYLHPLHMQSSHANMFANNPFQRTFASVVSCKPPMHPNHHHHNGSKTGLISTNSDGILNNFLKKIVIPKRTVLLPPKMPTCFESSSHVHQKEFEDFKTIPSYLQNQKSPIKSNTHTLSAGAVTTAKNRHAKQRHNIEHDIRVDCDIFNIRKVNNNINQQPAVAHTKPTVTVTDTHQNNTNNLPSNNSNPPFEIYSLEEFPAIPATITSHDQPPATSQQQQRQEIDDSDYVKYQDDIAKTTPTFVPRRMNLCEKVTSMVKNSPKKFLSIPMMSPRRSCLKPTVRRRTVSECSDDFIVFDRTDAENGEDDSEVSEMECDESDISDEEDNDSLMQHDVDSDDDEEDIEIDDCDGNDENNTSDTNSRFESHQPDSGMEERKVSFLVSFTSNLCTCF